jgi:hypothetical protein
MSGEALAVAAEALAGVRFRLHGRDPATGLDCFAVLAAALEATGREAALPTGYRLRARFLPPLEAAARACGFAQASGPIRPGDAMFVRMGPCQFHLVIAARGGRFVHADAGLKRVVVQQGPLPGPIAGHWRLAEPS